MLSLFHDEIARAANLAPVALGTLDEDRWVDWDLASLAENRLDDRSDPRDLDDARRADWMARATLDPPWKPSVRREHERCFWILEDGERAGTIAIGLTSLARARTEVGSLYVLPAFRGRGIGKRALAGVTATLAAHGLGVRLDTYWCWPKAIRFYLGIGMWISTWKHDLTFCSDPSTPRPRVTVDDRSASLEVSLGDGALVLARAHLRGDALELDEPPRALADDPRIGRASRQARSTLALALAVRGWPLIRSKTHWNESSLVDPGAPESLARRIAVWEAWSVKLGWTVRTPRIPRLEYPTWEELEAR